MCINQYFVFKIALKVNLQKKNNERFLCRINDEHQFFFFLM